jgi:Family of unknown function (DUF6600)/FecR protein
MSRANLRRVAPALGGLLLGIALPLSAQQEYSHARIVRLSFVEGTVSVLRSGATDWANASVNTPVEEGFQLSTDKNSYAEVQFENGSTARIGELTLLKFDQLGLTESGESLNKMTLDRGYGTFEMIPGKTAVFEVHSADATLKPRGKSEFRVDVDQGQLRLEVFKGALDVESPEVNTTLARDNELEITPNGAQPFTLNTSIKRDDWDEWVSQRDEDLAAATPPAGVTGSVPSYGWSDLNQYGTWSYFDGYGYGWVPDVAGPWSPFSAGQWCWYPGFGYTWISYEPWGWLPYHFGGWNYTPLFGWAWFPGASWGWRPATVNWYQGAGWVGWAPSAPVLGRTGLGAGKLPPPAHGCPGGAGCLNAVNVETFRHGGPLKPREFLKVKAAEGDEVRAPDVQPGHSALLAGTPAKLSTAQEALVSGTAGYSPVRRSPFTVSGSEPHQFSRRAPESVFTGSPAQARGSSHVFWGTPRVAGGAPSIRSGGWSGGVHEAGGAIRGGLSEGSPRGGGISGGSHAGGVIGGSAPSGSPVAGGGHSGGGGRTPHQ